MDTNTVFCHKCGTQADGSARFCTKCGTPVAQSLTESGRPGQAPVATFQSTSKTAILCLVAGSVGLVTAIAHNLILLAVGAILAIIWGHQARREIRLANGTIGGNGLTVVGLVMGYVGVGLLLMLIYRLLLPVLVRY